MRAYPHAADGWSLSAASDSVGAAFAVGEFGDFGDVVGGDGDYYELGDVVAGLNVLGGVAGVMQAQLDGSAISAIHDAGAVTQNEIPFDSSTGTHKQHAHMTTGYGNTHAGIAHTVRPHRHCQVVG